MRLTPRYGAEPVLTMDGDLAAIATPAIRQRTRLAARLASFDDEQWHHPSRCSAWTARDVIVHLHSTNAFWSSAIASALRGVPTEFLATFDPVASPAQLVAAANDPSPAEVLQRFSASTEALTRLWASLGDTDWATLAEAPPGHISVSAVTHHALWDSWVHERDVLLPLGLAVAEEPDELTACLRYGAALGPALHINRGSVRHGTLALRTTDPQVHACIMMGERVHVRAGSDDAADVCLTGSAVELLEAFSIRRPFPQQPPKGTGWMLNGLAVTFDQHLE
jgi:uncharacterized protein (TIGR03083 family)